MKKMIWVVVILVVLGGAWWWWTGRAVAPATTDTGTAGETQQQPSTTTGTNGSADQTNTGQPVPVLVSVASDTKLGNYLAGKNGMTVYMYSKDSGTTSACTGTCATNWPPYTIADANEPLLGGAGTSGLLTTIKRADGTLQLAYGGHPLYYYVKDTKAGDTTGQGVGGVWYVVKP